MHYCKFTNSGPFFSFCFSFFSYIFLLAMFIVMHQHTKTNRYVFYVKTYLAINLILILIYLPQWQRQPSLYLKKMYITDRPFPMLPSKYKHIQTIQISFMFTCCLYKSSIMYSNNRVMSYSPLCSSQFLSFHFMFFPDKH